jgi:fucose 4-O-acetylase-like acetyltransferase
MSVAAAARAHVEASPRGAKPARDPWPDNAKLALIVLVAVGHLLSKGITGRVPAASALYVWIYLFHMPAFIFLAGYFSRGRTLSERTLQSVVTRLLVPFVIFTVLYAVALRLGTGQALRIDVVDPYWLLWFLPALAAWRLLVPIYLNLRWPLAIAVGIGLGVGMLDRIAQDFTLSRIFALAPFFVLGALTTPERLRALQQPLARVVGAAVLVLALAVIAVWHERIGTPSAIYWNDDYAAQGLTTLPGLGVRLLMYVVGTVLLLAVLAVVPTRRTWLTGIGAASLYVYLLHGFLVRGASSVGLLDHVTNLAGVAALVVVSTGVCLLLGSPPVRRLTRPFVEPRLQWLLRRDDEQKADTVDIRRPDARPDGRQNGDHWSKSSTTSSVSGTDWQASTKPPASSSGSSA